MLVTPRAKLRESRPASPIISFNQKPLSQSGTRLIKNRRGLTLVATHSDVLELVHWLQVAR
jgi:hypothetical protein